MCELIVNGGQGGDELRIHAITCGRKEPEENCATAGADGKCPTCRVALWVEYGFCRYGLGAFDRCPKCYAVFNFSADDDDE